MPTLDEAFDATFGATPAPAPLSEKPPRGLDEAFNATFGSGDTKLKATLTDAVRRDPVKTARAHELSKRTGLHPDAVVNSLMDVEMQQAVADADVLLQTDASMLKRFRDQPLFAAKAQKDLKALIELHGELKGFKGPEPTVMNIIRGLSAVPGQTVRTIKAGLGVEAADFLESIGATHPDDIDRRQRQREMTQAQNASSYTRPEFETTLGSGLYGIGETAIRMAPSLATLAITKSPTASLAVMGAQVQPESYLKYRERGATPGEATLGSTLETATELVTEIPTMNFMVKAFGKAGFGKFLSGVLGRETATEEINTLITDAIDTAIANPNKTWEQYLTERPSRALETLITTVGYSGLLAGASSLARRLGDGQAAAQYAQEDADRLKNAFAATKLVQMREHAPADFGSAIQSIADEEDGTQKSVFIDADVFNQAIEKLPKDQLQKLQLGMPDVLAQVPNSLSTGASIEVPIGVLLATVTDTPLEDLFLQNSRANEHSLSLVEAKQASEQAQSYMATEAEKVMQQAADTNATQVSAEAVKSNILGQLATANRFTADVNETQATLIRDFYTTLAGRLGTTPEDAYARFPLQITAENVAGDVLNSGDDIGREMADRIAAEPDAAVAEYNALEESNGGQILNTDLARELSPQYRADRTRSADVHEASSAFVKKMYADRLAAPTPEGKEPVVLFTAGGTGAGKSTGLAKVGGLASTAEIIFDTNMNTFESADKKVQQALSAGRKVAVVYTFRDPVEALALGALPRAMRMGRTVPLDAHEETHTGARLVMDQLAEKYAGNPDVEITAIDNSKGKGNAEITALANIPQMADNDLKGKLHAALEEAYQTGTITEAIYRGTKGDVNAAGAVQPGSNETAGPQLEQQGVNPSLERFTSAAEAAGFDAPLAQPARGTFNPRTLELSLLKDADLSTLSHELGHFFLEVMANVSTSTNAPEAIVNDMATVLKWFGVKDIAAWNAMTLDQKRPYHEKFAESWEQYLFEGNAPTVELKPLFRRFREWMVNVYRSLEEFARTHNTQLNDEVRAVFGRMVAAEDQIKEAERTAGMLPDFNATNEAIEKLQARTLRDLKWTVNARSKTLKRLQADVADKRKAVKDEVTAEVREQPEYKVQRFLKFGELDGEKVTGGKLSLPVLKEMYGEGPAALWRYVATNMVTVDKTTGLHPNMVAELFGFPNGDAMTRAIVEAFPEDTEIEGKTDQRLLERYGDLVTDKGIERAANLAIHNEVRARFVASELKAMREGMNPRGKTANGGSVNVLIQAAKEFAQNLVSRRKINELKPGLHTAAEARAGRKADAAQSAGDTAGALTAKRDQLLSHYAAKYTYEAQDEVDKKLDYLRKFDKKSVRDKLPPDYMLQIDALLEQYDLRRGTTNKDITKRASLQAWVDAQLEMGLNPVVPQHILEDAALKSYKLLSVEEFRGLVDTVRNIEHLGRLKDKLLTLQDKRAFAAVVADVSNSILDNATKEHFDRVNAPTAADQAADLARDFFSSHRKISSLVRQMDGFTDNGVLWNVFSRTMNKAADTEASMREGATKRLAVIFKGLKGSMGELAQIPGIRNSLSLETRLAVALNWGNETNQQRVMSGDNWSQAQVDGILQSLTANQLHFVQNVWDFIDSYWPDIKAKEERVSGVAPEKVAAMPFAVKAADGSTVDMKGGYYPIKYDTDRSSKAEADDAAEITKQMMVGHYARATTRRGHTQARVDTVTRAVRKDINVIFQHVEQVAHDLAWHEWLIDATRLLRAKPIEQAIRNTVGPQVLREFTKAVTDIAAGDVPAQSSFERMINHIRQGATITGLGWNVMTSLLQPFGLSQSMVRIGPKWVGKGLARWIGGAARMEGTVKDIYAQSEFMRLRGETMNREMREILNKVRNKNKSTLEATYFYLIQKGQLIADVPTWLGQYEKAVAHGADETNAVAQADQAVRDAQGSGATSDLARIQRGGPLLKLFTNFYSFFNTTFNLTAESYGRTNFKNPLEAGRFAVDMLLLYTVPSVLVSLMKAALRGDDEDDDELAAKLAREQLNYLFGTMVGLREASAAISGFNGYQGPAGTRFFSEATKLAKQIEQGEVDEAALKALNNTAGTLLHYPAGAINRLVEGYLAYTSGESDNPLAPVVGLPVK